MLCIFYNKRLRFGRIYMVNKLLSIEGNISKIFLNTYQISCTFAPFESCGPTDAVNVIGHAQSY